MLWKMTMSNVIFRGLAIRLQCAKTLVWLFKKNFRHTHRQTHTSSKRCQSLLLVGGPLVSISRHTHTQAVETAGQAKPVSVKATSSFEDRGSL